MRVVLIVTFLLVVTVHSFGGQLSMEDAEKVLLSNNIELRAKKAGIAKMDADILGAGSIPNPEFTYSLESLKNGERENEETYSLSQDFDIAGKRANKIRAARMSKEAKQLLFEYEVSGLLMQMRQAYYRLLLLRANERALSEIAGIFSEIEGKTDARVKAGDAAEADLLKLTMEKGKILRSLDELSAEVSAEKRKLALLLNVQEIGQEVSGILLYRPISFRLEELFDLARKSRPDLHGQSLAVAASEASLSASKREAYPDVGLEAGYKKQTGGFNGFVFSVSVPIPLFDRNQPGIARAATELEEEKIALELLEKTAVTEVAILFDRIAALQKRIDDLGRQMEIAGELRKIAGVAYEEGETGLLELLDAMRSEKELLMEHHNSVYSHWTALFELERATGTKLSRTGGEQ